MLHDLRERLDPYTRPTSPLCVPVKAPKATGVEPALPAEIESSAITAERRLRAPVLKGIGDDLLAPRKGPNRKQTSAPVSITRSEANILQLLPGCGRSNSRATRSLWADSCQRRAYISNNRISESAFVKSAPARNA
jgi:hypothetical protein